MYVAALDAGTTGTRCLLVDREAEVVAETYESHEQRYPEEGWVEHDPEQLWTNARRVVERALSAADADAGDLASLGVANQRETTVLWERSTGTPVADAVVWQDRRTVDRVEAIPEEAAESIRERTGLEPDAYFSATKLEWLLDQDDRRERARRGELAAGTVDSWLLWRLTGQHVTDVTNASRTMLFDVHDLAWDPELLERFSVPPEVLPEVRPSVPADPYGQTRAFGAPVPVAAALGDQQAALFGQRCFDAGEAKTTCGTGSFVLQNTGERAVDAEDLLTTVAYQVAGEAPRYALEGSVFTTGAAVEWLADLGIAADPADVERLAAEVDDTDGAVLVPAFQGLGAPFWDGRARGTVVGLSRSTRAEHLARATLEAVACRTRDVLAAMAAAGPAVEELRIDGGAASETVCRLHADYTGQAVERPEVRETTALGAAFAAGLAVGFWPDRERLREVATADRRFEPTWERERADRRYERWRRAVERSRDWVEE
jgi:glycerol kinase